MSAIEVQPPDSPVANRPEQAQRVEGCATLHSRLYGTVANIGWILVRGDGTVAGTGTTASLDQLATQAFFCGAPRVVLKSVLGPLPEEAIAYAESHGWEIVPESKADSDQAESP